MKKIYILTVLTLLTVRAFSAYYTITKFPTTAFCSAYPSSYVTGSFSINETSFTGNRGLTKGQTSKTLILNFNNANYQFNPGTGTVTVTGAGVTINSYVITSTSITVTITTANPNTNTNVISFNNIQVRAMAAGSGYIRRQGGTFKVNNSTTRPSTSTSWGNFTSAALMTYSSSTCTQALTSTVYQGTTNNQILNISVVTASGACNPLVATAFNFNTTGSTSASTDILAAKLYYTGTVNSFSSTTLFGSVSNPSGPFTITGSATFTTTGTYRFWLVYDIKPSGTSIPGDVVDAQYLSNVISTVSHVPSTTNPAGTRQISSSNFYSIAPGTWSTTTIWSNTSGGPSCGCAPTAGIGNVYVNHAVSLNNSYTVDHVTVQTGGTLTNAATKILTVAGNMNTTGSGLFTATTGWVLNNLTTLGTGSSSSNTATTLTGNMSIGSGTKFTMSGGVLLTVNGNINVDGTLALGKSNVTNSNAAGTTFSGTGSITGSGTITLGVDKSIPASTNITIAPAILIGSGNIVTNNGTVNMTNTINGNNASSKWLNDVNSTLNLGGTTSSLMSTGDLDAAAVPNTINYSGSGAQSVKVPLSTDYYNLSFNSSVPSVKSLTGAITVNGDFTIATVAQVAAAAAGNTIDLYGNWINNSTNTIPFNPSTSTVYFDGATDSIKGSTATNFYNVNITSGGLLIGNTSAGLFKVSGDWINDGDFDHANSDVTFTGTTTLSGASPTTFNTIIINSTKTLTLHATETDFEGNITNNGTMNHNSGLVVCSGNGNTQLINGSLTSETLYQLTIDNPGGSVVLSRPLVIANALTLTSGTFTLSGVLTMSAATDITRDIGVLSAAPTFGASVDVIYTGTTAVTASYEIPTSTTVLNTLTISKTGGVTLSANVTVNTSLSFTAGIITTGAFKIIIANAASVSGAGAGIYVFGNLEKGIAASTVSKSFEIGDATLYTPVDLTFGGTATNAVGKIMASTTAGDHSQIATSGILSTKSVNRTWTLTNTGVTFGSYTAKFYFDATDVDVAANTAVFLINRYNAATWFATTIGTRTALTTQFTGGASATFGDFQIGESNPPTVTCPANVSQNNDAGLCSAVVTYTVTTSGAPVPTVTYVLSGATSGSGSGTGSGLSFNEGVTTVTLTATNTFGSGNCSFTITVVDAEGPVVSGVSATVNITTDAGLCTSTASLGTATATDNCTSSTVTGPSIAGPYPVGTTNVTYTATDLNGNTTTFNQSVVVTDGEAPSLTAPNDINICNGALVAPGLPFGSDNCGGVTFTNNAPGSYPVGVTVVTYVATDIYGNTASDDQLVTIYPVPPVGTPTTYTVCDGTSSDVDLNLSAPGCSYTWTSSVTTGIVIGNSDCAGGCGTVITDVLSNLTIATAQVQYTVTPTSAYGCGAGAPYIVTVNIGPVPTAPVLSGSFATCGLATVTFTATSTYATSYVWTTPPGITITSGDGTSAITCSTVGFVNPGYMTCSGVNACGAGPATSQLITKKPAPATVINGPVSVCGLTFATYWITPCFSATSYNWTVPAGMVITSGAGTTSINVSITASAVLGNLRVDAVNACGFVTGPTMFIVGHAPAIPVVLSGPTFVCGLTTATYSIMPVAYATGYTWTIPSWMTIISGGGTTAINVVASGAPAAGTVTVSATNVCGTGTQRVITLTLAAIQPGAITGPQNICGVSTAAYSIASVGTGYTYTWTLSMSTWTITSGQGTTAITCSGTSAGTSTAGLVQVTSTNTCGNTSAVRTLAVTYCKSAIADNPPPELNSLSDVYPNPSTAEFKIDITSDTDTDVAIQVYDILGNLLINEKRHILTGNNTLKTNVEKFSKGMYFVRLLGDGSTVIYTQRLIKE